jgi:hypothetical protein
MFLWGCASLRLLQEDAFDVCVRACLAGRHASTMSAHELAMTFWSVASLAKLAALETEDKACVWHRQASVLKRPQYPLIRALHTVRVRGH